MNYMIDNPMCQGTCANCKVATLTEENEQLRHQLAAASTSLQAANDSQVRERQIRFSDQALRLKLAQENAPLRQMIADLRDRIPERDMRSLSDYLPKESPGAMIYIFNGGKDEARYVSHVFEATATEQEEMQQLVARGRTDEADNVWKMYVEIARTGRLLIRKPQPN